LCTLHFTSFVVVRGVVIQGGSWYDEVERGRNQAPSRPPPLHPLTPSSRILFDLRRGRHGAQTVSCGAAAALAQPS
jgi:hypothetical protein